MSVWTSLHFVDSKLIIVRQFSKHFMWFINDFQSVFLLTFMFFISVIVTNTELADESSSNRVSCAFCLYRMSSTASWMLCAQHSWCCPPMIWPTFDMTLAPSLQMQTMSVAKLNPNFALQQCYTSFCWHWSMHICQPMTLVHGTLFMYLRFLVDVHSSKVMLNLFPSFFQLVSSPMTN